MKTHIKGYFEERENVSQGTNMGSYFLLKNIISFLFSSQAVLG